MPNTTNEQARGGQKEIHVPMEVDVSGSEPEEEDWGDVDEVRRGVICYKCGMTGHFAKDSAEGHSRVKGKVETEALCTPQVRANR